MTRHRTIRVALMIAVLAVTSLGLSVAPAGAGDTRAFVSVVPPADPRVMAVPPNDPRVARPAPNDPHVRGPRTDGFVGPPHRRFERRPVFVVPPPVYVVVAPAASCLAPGYWTYQWVPATYMLPVWVPSQWSPDGTWIDGHYEPRVVSTGSYQPLWVPERWVC